MEMMMLVGVFCILLVVLYLGFIFLKENRLLRGENVDYKSEMAQKYQYLIERMTKSSNAKILVLTDKEVYIRSVEKSATTNFYITEKENLVEIKWIAQLSKRGTHEQIWTFEITYSQEKMIDEIEIFLEQKAKRLNGNIL